MLLACELLNPRKHSVLKDDNGETWYYPTTNSKDVIVRAIIMAKSKEQLIGIDALELQKYLRTHRNDKKQHLLWSSRPPISCY